MIPLVLTDDDVRDQLSEVVVALALLEHHASPPPTGYRVSMDDRGIGNVGDPERFFAVLREAVAALEDGGIPYAVVGSAARTAYGTAYRIEDADLFVMPNDADCALAALDRVGFEPERTDPSWLYKARKDDVLVDIIFRGRRGFELVDEMLTRRRRVRLGDTDVWMRAPEDQVLLELVSDAAVTPTHWRSALEILEHQPVDWSLLEPRGDGGRERLLALLLYARTEGIVVPSEEIRCLAAGHDVAA